MIDIRQGRLYSNYLTGIGWKVERIQEINYFIRPFPLAGSVLKIQRPEEIRMDKIKKLQKKYRVFQTIIEPRNALDAKYVASMGFKLTNSPYLPSKTLQIDLTLPAGKLTKKLSKDARYALRKTEGVKTRTFSARELGQFGKIWKNAVGMKRYVPPLNHLMRLKHCFREKCLFTADEGSASGAVFLYDEGLAYYWQAFTGVRGRKALSQYKIIWEGLLWAKRMGAKIFDFEGIYDERFPNKSWLGFTHFKKSFGGYTVEYPGCFKQNRFPFK